MTSFLKKEAKNFCSLTVYVPGNSFRRPKRRKRALKNLAVCVLLAAGLSSPALAITVTKAITTTATPEQTWAVIANFDGISTWLPPAASSPADHGNDIGSVRTITLKADGNPTVVEKLTAYDAVKHSYSYDIVQVDSKVLPVTNYHSTIHVVHAKTGSKVIWTGTFDAAAGVKNAAAAKAIAGVYAAGLPQIKTLAEKPQ